MNKGELFDFLRKNVELFRYFPDDRLKELIEGSRVATFEPNEAVIAFGEEGRFLGILLKGKAEVSVTDNSGEKHRISWIGPGDIFGEMSLMTGDKTVADIIGIDRCKALFIPRNLFSTILITYPPAIKYLAKTITDRARQTTLEEGSDELAALAIRKSDDPYGLQLRTDEPAKLLVVNCGSSSLKYNLFDTMNEAKGVHGSIERIGEVGMRHIIYTFRGEVSRELPGGGHGEAFAAMVETLIAEGTGVIRSTDEVTAIGHRVVHGGDKFNNSVVITEEVLKAIEALAELAPLHNPVNVIGIKEAQRIFPKAQHVAVFDTTFHHTLPPYAYLYGLPYELYEEKHIRRYGFHGISHFYVSLKAAEFLKRPFNELEIISCHLGNGASMCAISHGRSVDTSMGLTPTQGLLMGTRCGDLDPAVLVYLMRSEGLQVDDLDILINKNSGLKGVSGISNDMREIEKAAQEGHHRALLAFKTFCYQIRKYIGAYVAAMQGLNVVIFTGGIGQGSAAVRSLACQRLGYMGIVIDEKKNNEVDGFKSVCDISAHDAPVRVLVVPTNEERMIARETLRALDLRPISDIISTQKEAPVPIEVSAHHVHLCQEHVEALFGRGHSLTPEVELSQPGQFACKEKVNLIGPKDRVDRVRVLGPARKETQVEIAMTEQFRLGIYPPIRESGGLENTPGITIEGPNGNISASKGVICALRHIHMPPADALRYGLRDKYKVRVRVEGDRELIFGDVLVRVHPNYKLAMHLDTDEANAANIKTGMTGYITGIQDRN
jgi:acetate kinase